MFTHLYIEVFKCHGVSPEQLHGVPRYESDSKETLHLVRAGSLRHLIIQTGREENDSCWRGCIRKSGGQELGLRNDTDRVKGVYHSGF